MIGFGVDGFSGTPCLSCIYVDDNNINAYSSISTKLYNSNSLLTYALAPTLCHAKRPFKG